MSKSPDMSSQNQYNKYIEGKISGQANPQMGVIKASGGKARPGGSQAQGSQMGSNRMTNGQSRMSNKDAGGAKGDQDDDDESSSDDDQLHEEPPDMRVYPEFLKNLPGVQASDSMGYRIEALRVYLET